MFLARRLRFALSPGKLSCANKICLNRRFSSTAEATVETSQSTAASRLAPVDRIRNIAIIAHVDHGKTTLVDCLLKQAQALLAADTGDSSIDGTLDGERLMDSNALERERGITILSKAASIEYAGHRINIVDTPGHADFGGEVERVLSMVDGVILVVDGTEGPMTQTRFVLSKALKQNIRPLVLVNKVDRPTARLDAVESEVLDLFLDLEATDEQMDYPIVFASAKEGWAVPCVKTGDKSLGMKSLFDLIIKNVPHPQVDRDAPFSMLVTQLENDSYVGKCLIGRIQSGTVSVGDRVKALDETGKVTTEGKVLKMFQQRGLERNSIEIAGAGDIVSIAGLPASSVNATLCAESVTEPIAAVPIDPPTVSMTFSVNDSPLMGQEGSRLNSSMIRERLLKEVETNVAMKIVPSASKDCFDVRGRGELHLGILIENMRREGFELCISPPRVIFKRGEKKADGKREILEPMEEVAIDVPMEFSGMVIQKLNKRKAEMKNYVETSDRVKLSFVIPARGLLGFLAEFKHETSGQGVINHIFVGHQPYKGEVDKSRKGSIVSTASGITTTYALLGLESRGVMFVKPGDQVYAGMVIGEHNRDNDLEVNPVKAKKMTNVRSVSKDETVKLAPHRNITLEQVLSYVQEDEIVEVTPKNIRISKKERDPSRRSTKVQKSFKDFIFEDE